MAAQPPPPYAADPGYPPPQAGYPPPQAGYPGAPPPEKAGYPQPVPVQQPVPAQTVTVVTQQPVVVPQRFGETPVTFTDADGSQVTTRIEYRSGGLTWIIFALVCFLTGCICFAVIPFCIDATKDVYHINPKNGSVVGVYKRV